MGSAEREAGRRPEIQALRAIAVLAVVIFHLSSTTLPGGYVGVDIFFGISGYLIIGHLLRERERTGTVRLAAFWARRARRLLPASLLVIVVSGVAVLLLVPTVYWEGWFQELGASTLYVENWLLASNSVDYLAASNVPSPVQHYWSLSVEEQFYVAWPVLIVLLSLLGRVSRLFTSRRAVFWLLLVVSMASFTYSAYQVATSPAPAYFDTFGRAWEFGAGGLLALGGTASDEVATRLRGVLGVVGLAMIVGTVFVYNASTPFPGPAALLPVAGTLLVIWAGTPERAWLPARAMALRPVQWLGDVSYSLYLWHWPLIVLAPFVLGGDLDTVDHVAIFFIALVLAWATKRFVEDVVRSGPILASRPPWVTFGATVVVSALVIAGCSGAYGYQAAQISTASAQAKKELVTLSGCLGAGAMRTPGTCPRPYAVTALTNPSLASVDFPRGVDPNGTCKEPVYGTLVSECRAGDLSSPSTTVAVVGDSHAGQFYEPLDRYGLAHGVEFVFFLKTYCPGTGDPNVDSVALTPRGSAMNCATWGREVEARVAADKAFSAVIFANYTRNYLSSIDPKAHPLTAADFTRIWQPLIAAGRTVIAIRDTPESPGRLVPQCVAEHMSQYDPCATTRVRALLRASANPMLTAAAALPAVKVIDLTSAFCDAKICHSVIGGLVVYLDSHHLTATFSTTLEPLLAKSLRRDLG